LYSIEGDSKDSRRVCLCLRKTVAALVASASCGCRQYVVSCNVLSWEAAGKKLQCTAAGKVRHVVMVLGSVTAGFSSRCNERRMGYYIRDQVTGSAAVAPVAIAAGLVHT
jgi:hypothetical protein